MQARSKNLLARSSLFRVLWNRSTGAASACRTRPDIGLKHFGGVARAGPRVGYCPASGRRALSLPKNVAMGWGRFYTHFAVA